MLPEQPERSLDGGTKPGTSLSKILMGVPVPKAINPCLQSTDVLFSCGHSVNGLRGFVIERLVKPLTIVKSEIFSQARYGLGRVLVIVQVNLFVFDAAPESFDEDVVQRSTAPIHTDGDFVIFENSSERIACELRSLIRVEDLWPCHLQRSSQRARPELALHRRRDFPTENES